DFRFELDGAVEANPVGGRQQVVQSGRRLGRLQNRHKVLTAKRLHDLVGDVDPRADRDGVLKDDVVALLFGNSLDSGISLFNNGRKLFVAATVEVFLEFTALALELAVEVGQLTLTLDTLGLGQHGRVFVKLLGLAAQAV